MSAKYILPLLLFLIIGCKENKKTTYTFKNALNQSFTYNGRTDIENDTCKVLINSAASVEFLAEGDSLAVYFKTQTPLHAYIAVTINDTYDKRYKIDTGAIQKIPLKLTPNQLNKVRIYKATEAANGAILFYGVKAQNIQPITNSNSVNIEFIGNSITCGMGADTDEIPCGEGEWFDQHNAYLAYGPRVAKALHANFILNSFSGIGMYRNWNSEPGEEPIMPEVYENLYLNTDTSKKYTFDFNPDIVSICLGTNDLSDGDGVKERSAFDKQKYINNYINFVSKIYSHYPNTKVALLTSPMISGEKGQLLLSCLNEVKNQFSNSHQIEIFEFKTVTPHGCSYHPDSNDHEKMANELIPFYTQLLNKN